MKQKNFTLLELLMVVAVIAVIAGGVIASGSLTLSETKKDMAEYREAILYKALVKFKKDMGYYPKASGQLDYASIADTYEYLDSDNNTQTYSFTDADFNSEKNFYQLLVEPTDSSNITKWNWSQDYKKGWQGPYLSNEFVRVSFEDWLLIRHGTQSEVDTLTEAEIETEIFLWSNSITAYDNGIKSTFFELSISGNVYTLRYKLSSDETTYTSERILP